MRPLPTTILALAAACPAAAADTINAVFPAPALDRWMYPFNSTPGTRPSISTFGSTPGGTDFDSRDGQMLVRFDTAGQVPTGQGSALTVTRATLLVEVANDLVFTLDTTPDPWQSFLAPSDPRWQADPDPGQPVECFGVGFRNDWSIATFQESTAYAPSTANFLAPGVRNAYAAGFDGQGALVDVSRNPREGWQPKAFAVGTIDAVAPGAQVPAGSLMRFELDVADPLVQGYLRDGVDAGRVMLSLSSLTFVVQGQGPYPLFIAKENTLVTLGIAQPARLELDVRTGPACAFADLNCDGAVSGADLGLLLGAWGTDGTPAGADLNDDGTVSGSDLGLLLGAWG